MVNDCICFSNIYKNDKIALINASSAKGVHDCILQKHEQVIGIKYLLDKYPLTEL